MHVFGLTGGVGMGKSTFAKLMEEAGCRVVDTDDLARVVVEPGTPGLEAVRGAFGDGVLDLNGRLDRARMARLVFADSAARRVLESILHPEIRMAWRAALDQWRAEGVSVGVVVIPLLFETGAEEELDETMCVACSPESQSERLGARGWSQEEQERRVQAQWPIERKMQLSHRVVWNEGKISNLSAQLVRILR